jgi:hypothetical protein
MMIRTATLFAFALAAIACGSDPQPSIATSATDRPDPQPTATAPAVASGSGQPAPAPSAEPGSLAHAAGDPATLLAGGQALEKLPTRAVAPGKSFNPRLRQQLMAPPPPDL